MKKIIPIFVILATIISLGVVAGAYPTPADTPADNEDTGPEICDCGTTPSGYTFSVEDGGRAFQAVQVVVNGQVYDMVYDNGHWVFSLCDLSKGNYYYIITTRYGIKFESSVQTL
ncbi:MAG: hypothetical protein AMQ22_00272 [Candidatus Methanofastidiosum methylothiophilum]|uniref:Uncharacterized protein n=1 Tax=Candidatus Methanofastidiosum methylothiophilum TaxID=1705564 RepID=A0A150J8B5_9EURY|nr:MAG: hypothetical protein AMQ22_00272 [Candidatus Methanofastidiosum methylthiophilus]